MSRPRVLYVPIAAGVEAGKFIDLVDWADVASFDAPGAGANRQGKPGGVAGVVDAARARIDELGWTRFAVVCDSHGQAAGIEFALRHADAVAGIFIGHAAARYGLTGDRTAMVPAVHDAAAKLLENDYRTFARAVTQMTQGLADDAYVEAWIAEVPQRVAQDILGDLAASQPDLVARLADAPFPVVLGKHDGCVMWTADTFEDACRAVPDARVVVSPGIPVHDPAFLEAMREVLSAE